MERYEYLDTATVARRYGLSTSWLNRLRVTGGGPVHYKLGRRVLYRPDDVEDWITRHRRLTTSENRHDR
jgi:predicted DNA-binding transcriptional regulator AlpA